MAQGERAWSWKVPDSAANEGLGLRYEPGSPGDLLKGEWAILVARALIQDGGPLRLLDPFAGAPAYPRVPAVDARLGGLPPTEFERLQRSFAVRRQLASTASLVQAACAEAGVELRAQVFDADPERRARWAGVAWAEALEAEDGGALLADAPPADLVNVDPYDLFERWEELVPRVLARPAHEAALLYLFNKAPRGAKLFARYRALRQAIAEGLAARGDLRAAIGGRIPSDPVLPRAYHEVLLIAPRPLIASVRDGLRAMTRILAAHLAMKGAFDEP